MNRDPDIDRVLAEIESKARHPAFRLEAVTFGQPGLSSKAQPSLIPGFFVQKTILHFFDSEEGPGWWTKDASRHWCGIRTWRNWRKVNREQNRRIVAEAERRWREGQ